MVNGIITWLCWFWLGNYISFTIAAGLIGLHMPSVNTTRASACHLALNDNHWHRLLEIPAITRVKSYTTIFNYVCKFFVNMFYCGRTRFNEFNHTDMKDMCCAVNVPLPLTDTVQLPVNGPCKSRYLAINVICTTVLSLNIQLYNCIAVFPRLHPNTTYMPNTDDTDYTDNRVVFIIWTDNVNAICTTTISSDIQLWYCIAVFPRLYPSNTYLPNTDYTDYTDNRVVFIIWTDNVNAPLTYHCR